jgi:hypothetical protein
VSFVPLWLIFVDRPARFLSSEAAVILSEAKDLP